MITCIKEYTIDVTGAGCFDDGTGATPASLVETGDGSLGLVVLPPPSITQGFPHETSYSGPFPVQAIMGRYSINYIGGVIAINTFQPPVPGGSPGYYYDQYITGGFGPGEYIQTGVQLVGGGITGQTKGLGCNSTDVPACDLEQLQSNTVAMNPVSRFGLDINLPWNFFLGTSSSFQPTTIISPTTPVDLITFLGLTDVFHASATGVINYQLNQVEKFPVTVKRCRIKDYVSTVKPLWVQGGTCNTFEDGSSLPEWEGNFTEIDALYPTNNQDRTLVYYSPGWIVDGNFVGKAPMWAVNGKSLANDLFGNVSISYRSVSGVGFWDLAVTMYMVETHAQVIWFGRKTTGKTPVGEYTFVPGSSCLGGPASVCVEAY